MSIVPSYHTLMLPLLKVMSGGKEMTTKQMSDGDCQERWHLLAAY